MQTQNDTRAAQPDRREKRQARKASAAEDVFKGEGSSGGMPHGGWLKRPWQPVGQLWRRFREGR